MGCIYTFKGKEYSEKEFKSLLTESILEGDKSIDAVLEKAGGVSMSATPLKEKILESSDEFKKLVHKNIESDVVKNTLSNIERETGTELTKEEKEYNEIKLKDALSHGVDVVEKSKKEFGENYVSKLLDYLDENKSTLSADKKSLIQIAMELDLEKQIKYAPDNVLTLKKQLKLVRDKSIAEQRSAARAIGYGRLRQIARVGYDIAKVTDQFFSYKELKNKKNIESAIQANAETIQKQYEENLKNEEANIESKIKEGVEAEIAKLYEALPKVEKTRADKAIAALDKIHDKLRNKTYESTIGIPVAIIDAGVVTIRAALKVGVQAAKAIELGIEKIKELYGKEWGNENEFRKDYLDGLKEQGVLDAQQKRQNVKEYRMLETERNRQLAKVADLNDKLKKLQGGERPIVNSKEAKLDVPEIEALKQKVKEETKKLNALDAQQKRIDGLEKDLERLQNRIHKEKTESVKREINEKEKEIKAKIEAEKETIRKENKTNNELSLYDAKKAVRQRIEKIKTEIANKERELKEKNKPLNEDLELTRLREIEKSITELRDKYLPKGEYSYADKKEAKAVEDKLVKENIELNRQIAKGEKDIKEKKVTIESQNIEKLKSERDARKEILEAVDPTPKLYVQNALIEQGFGKTMKIKTKNGVEERQVLDWKKLAGEEGSVDKISENVAKLLEKSGFTQDQLERISDAFIKEYTDIRASVIEKGLNEIENRNKKAVTSEQKSAAKKLAEMYNYGLFEQKIDEFDLLINKAIGSSLSEKGFLDAKKIADAMQTLYSSSFKGVKLSDVSAKALIQQLENNLRILLSQETKRQGDTNIKIANIVRSFMDIKQTMILNNLGQALENPFSGFEQNVIENINKVVDKSGAGSGEMAAQRRKLMRTVYKDMVLNGGIGYGDVSNKFSNRGRLDDYINKMSDSKLYHSVASIATGKATLDAMDAMFKSSITEKKFATNLIKILTNETNKNKMSKEEAIQFVSEKLTGQTLADARVTAKEVIDKINKDAKETLIPNNKEAIERFANDIVKSSLEMGGKISADEINAAYKAAYKAAGEGLGHEANNPLSESVNKITSKIEDKIEKAIKEKDWRRATWLTYYSIFWRNVANPFVGGGTNWLVLKAEKTGLGLFTGLGYKWASGKNIRIDMSTEAGAAQLEKALYNQARFKDKMMRGTVGGAASLLTYGLFLGLANTDEYQKWREKNKWAAKYLDKITPEVMLAHMSSKGGAKEFTKYLTNTLNKNDAFDASTKIVKAASYSMGGKKDKAWGALGEAVGSKIDFPIPWRLVKDGNVLYQGIKGEDPYHGDYKPSVGFWNGVFQGGLIEWLGLRPNKEIIEDKDSKASRSF